jgi:type VI secretion system protein ImpF
MSGLKGRERLQPSLLDRLTDHAPTQKRENFDQQTLSMAQLRQAVLRDLAWLLNATNLASLEDLSATPLAAKSTLNYGIPGFAGKIESTSRIVALERELAETIETYEPRIRKETLRLRSRGSQMNGTNSAIVFEIECEIWAQPTPQQLFLETAIEVETRLAVVTELKGAR